MIYVDIETLPNLAGPGAYIDKVKVPKNYKDPEKIHEYRVENAREAWLDTATNPLDAQLLVIGLCNETDEPVHFVCPPLGDRFDESSAMKAAWDWAQEASFDPEDDDGSAPYVVWCGFNSLGFDFRLLGLRALRAGMVEFARSILPPRYQGPRHKDVAMALGDKFISLDSAAEFFGVQRNKVVPGNKIAEAFYRGRLDDILASNADDLRTTRTIAKLARQGGLL